MNPNRVWARDLWSHNPGASADKFWRISNFWDQSMITLIRVHTTWLRGEGELSPWKRPVPPHPSHMDNPSHMANPPHITQGYFLAFSHIGTEGKEKYWLVQKYDLIANMPYLELLPYLVNFKSNLYLELILTLLLLYIGWVPPHGCYIVLHSAT